ncbi:hypothetical protein J3E64_001360 [Sphingobium sp. OAS761]|uniref:hypothetical protein n=1 Tax=Sphingobium sp. OAS761 TaxID=2817901 RepID=UPI00209FE1C7|nr:hypothetical protein [Sphingobium sp. OAS761]MCP1469678.1 hypothetical protein [Sphingobium sp. OAS761]
MTDDENPSEIRAEILSHAANGTLLDAIFNSYGRRWLDDNHPTILALAELHNTGDIDLLALVTPQTVQPYEGPVFFNGQNVFRALISRLQSSAEALLQTVQILIDAAGQDLAAGLPVEEFAKWCGSDPARPAELLALIDRKVPNAERFLTIALKSGVAVDRHLFLDRAYDFLRSGTETEQQGAINALGQIALPDAADWDRLLDGFAALLAHNPSDTVRAALITAVARRLNGAPGDRQNKLAELGSLAVRPLGDHTLDTAARTIAFYGEHLTEALTETLLEALAAINGKNKGTVEILDMAMMKLIERDDAERARCYLEPLLRRDDDRIELKQLDSLCYKLREKGGQTLDDWVVAWLLDGDRDLCSALDEALFGPGSDDFLFRVDFSRFGLVPADYPYLARKAIGTFFLKPNLMASLLVSLLRSTPETAEEVVNLLIDPILINYAGIAETYLKPIAQDRNDPASGAVQRALEGQEAYLEGLRSVGNVPELHPSERERRLEWQRHADSMAEAYRAARQKSVLASIATESLILYGTRAVSWFEDRGTDDRRRIETPMASISHSFEMPRVDIVDPGGLQMMLLHFRGEPRPS